MKYSGKLHRSGATGWRRGALTVAALLAVANAWAQVTARDPWARPTAPGQSVGGTYLKLEGGKENDRLISVHADIAQAVQIHSMKMEGDIMRMRALDGLEIPAGKIVELQPGGLHIMLLGLKTPLKVGNSFPLSLQFAQSGLLKVNVRVLPVAPGNASANSSQGQHTH
jgi:hypothetical protein